MQQRYMDTLDRVRHDLDNLSQAYAREKEETNRRIRQLTSTLEAEHRTGSRWTSHTNYATPGPGTKPRDGPQCGVRIRECCRGEAS